MCPTVVKVGPKTNRWPIQLEELATHSITATYVQQTILLADIFGKMRSTLSNLESSQMSVILMTVGSLF